MNIKELGHLVKADLRDVWTTEASEFTPWLAREDNLKLLGEAIGIDLELVAQEKEVGPFRADILCKDNDSDPPRAVIIENQIETTDHRHLGQVLTYAAGLDAAIMVWIAKEFTDEHRAALDWLNEKTNGVGFFGVEIEVWRIDDSRLAPKFNIISKPNNWSNIVKQAAGQGGLTETEQLRLEYWTALDEFLKSKGSSLRLRPVRPHSWAQLRKSTAIRGLGCGFDMSVREPKVDVYILATDEKRVAALRRIQKIYATQLDSEVAEKVEWDDNTAKGRFCIYVGCKADPSSRQDWARQHEWMKTTMEKLVTAVSSRLTDLKDDGQ